jgi:hypothetical protein
MVTVAVQNIFVFMVPENVITRNFKTLPSIIRMIKLRRMRWAGHIPGIREKRNA